MLHHDPISLAALKRVQDRVTDHRLAGDSGGAGSINGIVRMLTAEGNGEALDSIISALDSKEVACQLEEFLENSG